MTDRCGWGDTDNELYRTYHDTEWGKLNLDEKYLYEMLVLESFQSGLSWATILNKRDNFRKAFANFDVAKVAKYDQKKIEELMNNKAIVRNRRKILAAINNAQVIEKWHRENRSFAAFLQKYIPKVIVNHPVYEKDVPSKDETSIKIAKALKKEGFQFVGPTTIYSFLQAIGLVNDHIERCDFKYEDGKI